MESAGQAQNEREVGGGASTPKKRMGEVDSLRWSRACTNADEAMSSLRARDASDDASGEGKRLSRDAAKRRTEPFGAQSIRAVDPWSPVQWPRLPLTCPFGLT